MQYDCDALMLCYAYSCYIHFECISVGFLFKFIMLTAYIKVHRGGSVEAFVCDIWDMQFYSWR